MNIRYLLSFVKTAPEASAPRWVIRVVLVSFALLSLASCAGMRPLEATKSEPFTPTVSRPDGAVRVDTTSESVAQLWAAAEQARQENKIAIALELLYEGIEISPQNSLLWSRAAELQLDSLEAVLAENYAVKSNVFAGENIPLLYRNWLIIEQARNMRGDLLGVRSAHKKVQQYQYQ
jgi:hypothetical protein